MMKPGIDYIGISVAFFCHDGAGNFVFHKRSANCRDQQGTWDSGGGKLEFGETPEQALWREIEEEYGCSGQITSTLPPNSFFNEANAQPTHWLILPYIVQVNRAEVKLHEPEKMDELGWFTLNSLPEPLHPGVKKDLEKYAAEFIPYLQPPNVVL